MSLKTFQTVELQRIESQNLGGFSLGFSLIQLLPVMDANPANPYSRVATKMPLQS